MCSLPWGARSTTSTARGRGDGVDDADDRLLRDGGARVREAARRRGAPHREGQRVPVRGRALDGMAGEERHA